MPAYPVCGLESLDTGALFIAAVYHGHLPALDGNEYIEQRCGLSRWAEHVSTATPAQAEPAARDTHRYGGQIHPVPASQAETGDILVYDDGDTARIAAVEHTGDDDVHLTVYDRLTGETSVACYDPSALLHLARAED
jgi:hypothetical protein